MYGNDELEYASAGEERDAFMRSLAEDMVQARRGGRGIVKAERPADLAQALGRDRRAQAPRHARSAS